MTILKHFVFIMRNMDDQRKAVSFVRTAIGKNKYGGRYLTDLSYRTKISLYLSSSINIFYAVFKLAAGIYYASFWYGADALFYIALSAARLLLLRYVRKEGKNLSNGYRQYRFCGYLLFVLNVALIALAYQVATRGMSYEYPGFLIYAEATYAFFCLALAIVNVLKYGKLNNPILSAANAISLTKALVAMFALQTAMLVSFGGADETFKHIINSISGGAVCLFIFAMAVLMIAGANKKLKSSALTI